MQKDTFKQSDLPALINEYQHAYWQASSMATRNAIARQLWDLRREANLKQRLLQHDAHQAPDHIPTGTLETAARRGSMLSDK